MSQEIDILKNISTRFAKYKFREEFYLPVPYNECIFELCDSYRKAITYLEDGRTAIAIENARDLNIIKSYFVIAGSCLNAENEEYIKCLKETASTIVQTLDNHFRVRHRPAREDRDIDPDRVEIDFTNFIRSTEENNPGLER